MKVEFLVTVTANRGPRAGVLRKPSPQEEKDQQMRALQVDQKKVDAVVEEERRKLTAALEKLGYSLQIQHANVHVDDDVQAQGAV